jgi:hypothetical protein
MGHALTEKGLSMPYFGSFTVHFSPVAPTVIPGDVTGDGQVGHEDVAALFRYVAAGPEPGQEPPDPAALDVNEDGKVNNRDTILLFRRLLGKT